ncbi:MAG TPA: hypothetical protein PLS81_10965 [Deltaproteobacteria bacterium]|nr:hypothetical protein [Deltaproteobacteria bacterium]HPP81235.1 hypothetical protein [Deltaproteobacteria bacterium]
MFAVLKHWHPVMGVDYHIPWPPGSPSPAPTPAPYKTMAVMVGTGLTSRYATTHTQQGLGFTMQAPTDVGPGIPHVGPPSQTLPLDIAFSSSKSYFGPANIQSNGERIAAALLGNTNPNLDCGTPVPTPTGLALALTTVYVDMSLADILNGFQAMAADFIVQSILNWLGNKAGELIEPYASYLLGRFAPQVLSKQAAKALLRSRGGVPGNMINEAARQLVQSQRVSAAAYFSALPARSGNLANAVTGFFMGGPMGMDASTFGLPTLLGRQAEAVTNYLSNPGVDEHGGSTGGAGQTGAY